MKVIIAGSRDITDYNRLKEAIALSGFNITEVVCGLARGVDLMGSQWAEENGIPEKEFPADWKTHGVKAGFIRNQEMADYAEALIAIWDGESRGTEDMITRAKEKGLKIFVDIVPKNK